MKLANKSILLIFASVVGCSLIVGNVFASYIVASAPILGARVTLGSPNYFLYDAQSDNRLPLDVDGNSLVAPEATKENYKNINLDYEDSLSIQSSFDNVSFTTLDTYSSNMEGVYDFNSYNLSESSFSVTMTKKAVYCYSGAQIKVYSDFYVHYFEDSASATDSTWPGDKMTLVSGTSFYRALIPAEKTKVIFNNGKTTNENKIQTGDLSLPADTHRMAYKLIAYKNLYGDYAGQGSWSELPTSITTENQTTATSSIVLVGSFNDWSDNNNYSMEHVKDGSGNDQYMITLTLKQGNLMKVKPIGDSWAKAGGYSEQISSYFEDDGSDNHNAKCKQNGTYTLYVKLGSVYYFCGVTKN